MTDTAVPAPVTPNRHFLTFRLDDRHYALPAEDIAEVIRVPTVARMPQSPAGLLGLANLRGSILPVASGRELLGQPRVKGVTSDARAVVLAGSARVALAVDAVMALVELPASQVETREAELSALPGEILQGAFQPATGGQIVKLLDIQALLRTAIVVRERPKHSAKPQGQSQGLLRTTAHEVHRSKMVAFAVAGQEYALPLECVQEIMAAPALLAIVPHSDAVVLGVATFRNALLPLLHCEDFWGFPRNTGSEDTQKVVVTKVHGDLVGLVVDGMRAIFPADDARIEPIPDVLAARIGGESRVRAIYRGDHGLVSILAPEQLFGEDVMQKLDTARTAAHPADVEPGNAVQTQQFLAFRLGDEEFGLPIAAVEEVARVPDIIARVPKTPKFLEGVINLRGEVLPVIDQRKRFNMPAAGQDAARRLVVVRTERHLAGLIVDSVSEVLRAGVDAIGAAPDLTGEASKLVQGVINLESQGRIVLLLDPAELLTRTERGVLDTFGKQQSATESSGA